MNVSLIMPEVILAGTALVVLLVLSFYRQHALAASLTVLGLAAALGSFWWTGGAEGGRLGLLLEVDSFARFLSGLLLLSAVAVVLLAYGYLEGREEHREEFYVVLLIATLGGVVLVASSHFITFFVGLETLSVSLYVMIAYLREGERSLEAGLKYVILSGASSAFLLFGMALMYAATGGMSFATLAIRLYAPETNIVLVLAGLGLLLVGFGFKLGVAPFHMWTPDVYEGAPAPVTAFVATVSKGAVVGALVRMFMALDVLSIESAWLAVALIAVGSMFAGNLLALMQRNVKRLLAYSSIAHLGYILVAFLAGGEAATEAVLLYLVVYTVTILGAFGVIGVLSGAGEERMELEEYRGLFWHRPWLAGVFSAMMLSLAGIPLTAGFVGKFFVLTAGIGSGLWVLAVLLVVNSGIGIFYYLRVMTVMFAQPSAEKVVAVEPVVPMAGGVVIALLTAALFLLGVYPTPLIGFIREMVFGVL